MMTKKSNRDGHHAAKMVDDDDELYAISACPFTALYIFIRIALLFQIHKCFLNALKKAQ